MLDAPSAVVLRTVYLRWAGASGIPPRVLLGALCAGPLLVASASVWAASSVEPSASADVWLMAVCVLAFVVAMGVGIVGAHFSAVVLGELRALRVRPVGRALLVWATRMPVLVLALAGGVGIGPATVLVVERASGYGWAHAVVSVSLTGLAGFALGWLTQAVVTRALFRSGTAPFRLSMALVLWLAFAIGGLVALGQSLQAGGDGFTPLVRVGVFVWPLLLWLMLSAEATAYLAGVVVCALLWAAVAVVRPRGDETHGGGEQVRRHLVAQLPLLPARMTWRRMVRNQRTREWLVLGVVTGAMTAGLAWWTGERLAMRLDTTVLSVLAAQLALSVAPLVRGLSDRRYPREMRWGYSPATMVGATFAVCLAWGLLVSLPTMVISVSERPDVVGQVLLALVLDAAIGVSVGFWLVPRLGSGGAEFVAFGAYFVLCSLAWAIPAPTSAAWGEAARAALLLLLAVSLLGVAVLAERRHRGVTPIHQFHPPLRRS